VPVEDAAGNPSIKEKFGVSATGTARVDAAFKELSAFIKKNGLADDWATDTGNRVIKLGD
jgi:hypothetical protein